MLLILTILLELTIAHAEPRPSVNSPQFIPCEPESELLNPQSWSTPSLQFCQQWSPDFRFNGGKCCGKLPLGRQKKRGRYSFRGVKNYCEEVSQEQSKYAQSASEGKLGDILNLLTREIGTRGDQAYCTVNNGFLVHGRPIVPTPRNRIIIRSPERCLNFGTDAMAAMMEWVGREVGKAFSSAYYAGVKLVLGDVSGPKGGSLIGRSGRRGHASHTTGQDADIGFLSVKRGKDSPVQFVRDFDPANNWWLIKKVFKNPFACTKVIFLDRKHIKALARYAKNDEDWSRYQRFIRHMPGHKNHFHVRVGPGPGQPGCGPGARPELETEEDFDMSDDPDDSEILDQLKASQSVNVQQ